MSDNKDNDATKSPIDFDFDSTVQLNLGKDGNIVSTSLDETSLDDDFDKTINGLMEIDDLLNEGSSSKIEPTNPEEDATSEAIDFDELNAGIEALSENHLQPIEEADENLLGDEYMPEISEKPEENEDMFDLDISDLPDVSGEDESEFLTGGSGPITEELPLLEPLEEETAEETQPVIELTEEEMLDEPEELSNEFMPEQTDDQTVKDLADDLDTAELSTSEDLLLSEAVRDVGNELSGQPASDEQRVDDAGTPELSTTETNIISEATAAIKEINEDEKVPEIEVEAVLPFSAANALTEPETDATPVTEDSSGSSNTIPVLFGILGMAVGGFGAWMANDVSGKIADLERQIQNVSVASGSTQSRDVANIQQRLSKIERRLTGTPTIEAAAPLGASSKKVIVNPVKKPATITPKTPIVSTTSAGDWVVNVSSHAKESLAKRENLRLQKLGLNSEVHTARIKGKTWYRVQIIGFASKDEAKAKLTDLKQRSGINGAWIGRR